MLFSNTLYLLTTRLVPKHEIVIYIFIMFLDIETVSNNVSFL